MPQSALINRRDALSLLGGAGVGLVTALRQEVGLAQTPGWVTAGRGTRVTFPPGAIIRTVLKDVSPDALASGSTMFHEHLTHLVYTSPPPLAVQPGQPSVAAPSPSRESSLGLMVEELRQAAQDGMSAIVDAHARGGARPQEEIDFLKKLAAAVPHVHIVVGGGPFTAPYPPEVVRQSVEELTNDLVRQAATQRWGSIGEVGTAKLEWHPDERKAMTAIARTHLRTALPIFTHIDHAGCAQCGIDQLDFFEAQGVDPRAVCIGHLLDIKPASEPLAHTSKALAKRGAWLGFDTVGHEMGGSLTSGITEADKVKAILEVLKAGYEDQVLLGADLARASHLKANWGNGFSAVLVQFVPKLKYAGVSDATLHKILVDNPRRFLAFMPKKATS